MIPTTHHHHHHHCSASLAVMQTLVPDIKPGRLYRLVWEVDVHRGFSARAPLWRHRVREVYTPTIKEIVGTVRPGDVVFVTDVDFNVVENQFTVQVMTANEELGWIYCGTPASSPDVVKRLYAMFQPLMVVAGSGSSSGE